jgi:hypothetical protein
MSDVSKYEFIGPGLITPEDEVIFLRAELARAREEIAIMRGLTPILQIDRDRLLVKLERTEASLEKLGKASHRLLLLVKEYYQVTINDERDEVQVNYEVWLTRGRKAESALSAVTARSEAAKIQLECWLRAELSKTRFKNVEPLLRAALALPGEE